MREYRLVEEAVKKFTLELDGITVLTEAASGNFVWTPIIAAFAGANVLAYSQDSRYGSFESVKKNTLIHAGKLGIKEQVKVFDNLNADLIQRADIITNTGFLRPINSEKLKYAKQEVVIPLMWETWEFREDDLDLNFCMNNNIPVLGTDESDKRLKTIKYLGPLAKKMLLRNNIELCLSNILILGQGIFAKTIYESIDSSLNDCRMIKSDEEIRELNFENIDAIIIADHETSTKYIGDRNALISAKDLQESNPWIKLIHITGNIDISTINESDITLFPSTTEGKPFRMSVTTDFVGPKPIIDLHTAGLKVGEVMFKANIKYSALEGVKREALKNQLCQDFSTSQLKKYS